MQLIYFLVTFCVSVIGGIFAGYIMKLPCLDEPSSKMLYTDDAFWEPKPGKVNHFYPCALLKTIDDVELLHVFGLFEL